MAFTIAITGKGGVGKTTIAAILIRWLVESNLTPVLAVDADPNSNLNDTLGLSLPNTLSETREEMKKCYDPGITKEIFIQMRLNQCLVENKGFDLIVMGNPEGPGCYCAANHLLSNCMDKLLKNYKFIVIDNEAGMEHISRLTTQHIDLLLIISDPSYRSIITASRLNTLAQKMGVLKGQAKLISCKVRKELSAETLKNIQKTNLDLLGIVPDDITLASLDLQGKNIYHLPINNPVIKASYNIFYNLSNTFFAPYLNENKS